MPAYQEDEPAYEDEKLAHEEVHEDNETWCVGSPSSWREGRIAFQREGEFLIEPHIEDTGKMHPLIAAAYHNRKKSPLCRLPDTILVHILRLVDRVTLECLRRCSRIFLRLFPVACSSAEDFTTKYGARFPWAWSTLCKFQPEEQKALLTLLEKDQYCDDCLAAYHSPDWQARLDASTKVYLHCSGCQTDHPACLFSIHQRQRPPLERICIGHEGGLRLCEHKTVKWPAMVSAANSKNRDRGEHIMKTDGGGHILTQCKRSKHVEACKSRRWSFKLGSSKDWSRHPTIATYFPFKTNIPQERERALFEIELAWSAHISLSITPDGEISPEEVAQEMTKLREQGARFIQPQSGPGQIAGSGLFDPNYCDCLEYKGRNWTAWDRPPLDWRVVNACRADPTLRLGRTRHGKHKQLSSIFNPKRTDVAQCHVEEVAIYGGRDESPHIFDTKVSPCSRGNLRCIRVEHAYAFALDIDADGVLRRMNGTWYQALDPESYNLTDDRDGFALYWCMAKGCKNYYQYNRSRLSPLIQPSDYTHACPH